MKKSNQFRGKHRILVALILAAGLFLMGFALREEFPSRVAGILSPPSIQGTTGRITPSRPLTKFIRRLQQKDSIIIAETVMALIDPEHICDRQQILAIVEQE